MRADSIHAILATMRWASVLFWLAGCTVAVEDYSRVIGQATCERAQKCGELAESVDCKHPGVWSDAPPELVMLAAGQVGYASSAAASCVERIRSAKCGVILWQTEECRAAFPGKLTEGAACGAQTLDGCASGLVCGNRNAISCGVCVSTTSEGQRPDPGHPCARGLRRGFLDGGVACVPRGEVGEACGDSADCLEWLRCSARGGSLGGSCVDDLVLRGTFPTDAGREGQPCLVALGTIVPIRFCFRGLRCVNDELCVQLADFAEPCTNDDECVSAHCIEGACAAPRVAGDRCIDLNCGEEGLWCDNGTCKPSFCE